MGALRANFTTVNPGPGDIFYAKAGWLAAFFWILGVSARLGFALYAKNDGGISIARFSASPT
ncbi:MAG: hypothetical protein ACRENX_11880 [Candidatus Dormibacteria bacterium]